MSDSDFGGLTLSELDENTKLTDEEKDEQLFRILSDWLQNTESSEQELAWRERAAEDYGFYAGEQDTEEVLAALKDQKRPNPVFNEIKPKIDTLIGLAAQLEINPAILPRETTDEQVAEVMGETFKFYRKETKGEDIELECFSHVAKSGRSLQGHFIDTSNPFDPTIKTFRYDSDSFWLDPDSRDYPAMEDARYLFIDRWIYADEIKAHWPDVDTEIVKDFDANNYGDIDRPIMKFFNSLNDKIRIVECWYKMFVKHNWFINPLTGKPDSIPTKEWTDYIKGLREGIPGEDGELVFPLPEEEELEFFTRPKRVVRYAIFTAKQILEKGDNPYTGYNKDKFPFSLYVGYKNDRENTWFGAVHMMKDPQRGLNTTMRQLIHLLQTSPKGILMVEGDAVLNEKDYIERSARANFILKLKEGSLVNKKVQFTEQPNIPSIYQSLVEKYTEFMKSLSGVQDVFLGIQAGSREPGITMQLRQQSGLAVLFIIFDNFRKSRIHAGRQLLSFIQQYITGTKFLRIDPKAAPLVVNGQRPDGSILNDLSVGEFDLVVEEAMEGATMKLANAKILTDFAQNNPGSIPPDVILDYTSMSYSVKQRVKEFNQQQIEAQAAESDAENLLEWGKVVNKADKAITDKNIKTAKKKADVKRKSLKK